MRFTPKSDEELYKLLDKGNYDFEVIEAVETRSKAGNDMIALVLKVFTSDGHVTLKDWLLDNGKLKRFCQSVGMERAYDAGELTAESVVGEGGVCKVDIENQAEYGNRNKIAGYVVRKKEKDLTPPPPDPLPQRTKANEQSLKQAVNDEEIPF